MNWTPIAQMPKPMMSVLVTCERVFSLSRTPTRYICKAQWIPAKTKEAFGDELDFAEYDEETDENYWPEGWYERVHNWGDYTHVMIEDRVIAWCEMPEPYMVESEENND